MDILGKPKPQTLQPIEKSKSKSKDLHLPFKKKIPPIELILAVQNLAVMLKSGLSIPDGFDVIIDQSQSIKLKETLVDVLLKIKSGESLYQAMKSHSNEFAPIILSVVNAGEQGGTLETNLTYLGEYLKKQYELKKKIKGALFYPFMIFGLSAVEGLGVIFFVLPQLETFFSSLGDVPPLTRFILTLGRFVRSNTIIIVILCILGGIGFYFFLKTKAGKYFKDYMMLHIPIISRLTKSVILSNFSRTMSILLQSGQPVYNALVIASETLDNKLYEKIILDLKSNVMAGLSMSDSFNQAKSYFPPLFVKMVAVGEKAGILEKNFESLNNYYTGEAEEISSNFAALIEPIMLIFVGIIVALLGITVIAPLYQSITSLKA